MKWFVAVITTCTLLLAPIGAYAQATEFVRVRDRGFVIGDKPYHFVGVNFWFAPQLAAGSASDRQRLARELDALQRLGIDNLRIMIASEGPNDAPQRVTPALQPQPGRYDEKLLRGVDVLLAELRRRDMRAVLILNNFFQWTGGMAQYVSWATGEPIPLPERDGHTWDEFQNYSARFYSLERAMSLYDGLLRAILTRRNTVTGVFYRDDPTVMSWQLANEPRGFAHSDEYVAWIERAGALVHALAPRQLVSLGGEGKLTPHEVTQFERVSGSRQLDYITVHIWIENWGWFRPKTPAETFDVAVGHTMGYLADHLAIARKVGKPVVIEEFGVSRDSLNYSPGASVKYRDAYLRILLEAAQHLACENAGVAGSNVWSWSGESRPAQPGAYWQPGSPFTGDPPHERQGWYSIYDSDRSTLAILQSYSARIRELDRYRATRAGADPCNWYR